MSAMKKLNPYAGLPNPKEVWAWGMYDFANQSFTLLINTLLFAIYFKEVVVGDKGQGDRLWAMLFSGSMLLVVIASPIIGALADAKCWRKQILLMTGLGCVLMTCGLGLIKPNMIVFAALLYIPANFCYQIGENILASFLTDVADKRNIGRVSAIGWTMGYVGALCLLVIVAVAMKVFGIGSPENWRPLFVFAGLWFLLGMIPTAIVLREHDRSMVRLRENIVADAFARVGESIKSASQYRELVLFLVAFFVFAFGIQTVIAFAAILVTDFGYQQTQLVMFVAQITVTAGIAAAATSKFQDKIGAKKTIQIYLCIWIASTALLAATSGIAAVPNWMLWVVGNGIGFGLGGTGTASRAMVARFTPSHKSAEFFGLWGVSYKLAGAVGVLSFGLVKASFGNTTSLLMLTGFFVVGFILMLPVNELNGVRAAMRATKEYKQLASGED